MGSGAGNGFSIRPDWSTYALLIDWAQEDEARTFFENDNYFSDYLGRSENFAHIYMTPFQTHGSWGQGNPWADNLDEYQEGRMAVITRATIKPHLVPYFWTKVRNAADGIEDYPGHVYSKGIGEWPLFMQATISMWESKDEMRRFAYESKQHQKVMKLTRTKNWYKEDMFTEFNVLHIEGNLI